MSDGWFLTALRHDRAVVLGSLGFVVALAWVYLWLGADLDMAGMSHNDSATGGSMSGMTGMPGMSDSMQGMAARGSTTPDWTLGYGLVVFVMWAVMMVAMMLPSAAPVTLLVAGIARRKREAGVAAGIGTTLFVAGYLAVWCAFAAAATLLQWGLSRAGLLSPTMALADTLAAGVVLVVAGIYQWTPLKQACLRHCRSPFAFLMFHWRDSPRGAFLSGVRHGAFCFGCCFMLMALLFVGGIMSLAWIAGIALLVLIEKTLPWGGRMSLVTGAVLVVWGGVTLAATL